MGLGLARQSPGTRMSAVGKFCYSTDSRRLLAHFHVGELPLARSHP